MQIECLERAHDVLSLDTHSALTKRKTHGEPMRQPNIIDPIVDFVPSVTCSVLREFLFVCLQIG